MINRSKIGGRRRIVRVAAVCAALALVAAACGGDDDDDDSDSSDDAAETTEAPAEEESEDEMDEEEEMDEGPEGGVSAEKLEELKVLVAAAAEEPKFEAQGEAFSVADIIDKKIFVMPVASSLTGCDNMAKWTVGIAQSIGMEDSFYFQNDGGPAAWQEGMDLAINGGYDGVVLVCGIDPYAIEPQMDAAREAGIAVVDVNLADVGEEANPLISAQTNGTTVLTAQINVYSALIASEGEPISAFIVTANENPPSVTMEAAIYDTFAELCSACDVSSQNIPIPDFFAGAGQSTMDAQLVANPDLDTVFLAYDFMAPVVEGSVKANNSPAKIYAFGGSDEVVPPMVDPETSMANDMGPDFLWMAYGGADQVFRAMAGVDVIPASESFPPYRLWTPENAAEKTTTPGSGFDQGFLQGHYDMWLDNPATEPYTP